MGIKRQLRRCRNRMDSGSLPATWSVDDEPRRTVRGRPRARAVSIVYIAAAYHSKELT